MGGRSSAAPAEQLVEVKPDQVSEQEGINPRTDVGNIAELTADVKARGVLQPILVREAGTAKGEKLYTLVAGRRRLEAARKAKLATVPARVVEMTDEQAQEAALVENLQRDDLAPLEEAQALDRLRHAGGGKPRSARQLAKLINRSDDWVSDRLRLLNLPLPVAAAIDRGAIGLHAMPALARISDSGPGGQDLAEQLAKDVESGDLDARSLERPAELVRALDRLTSSSGKDPVGAVEVTAYAYNGYLLKTLPIDQEVKDELADRWNALPATHDYSDDAGQKRKIAFGPEDADAAQAYGCLLEVEYPSYNGQTSKSQYITDRVFIADRTRLWLEQQEKDAKAAKRKAAKQEKPDAGAEQAAKDAKAAAEQQRREAGAAAIARNDELAKRTLAMRVKLTPEVLALLATAAVHGYSYIVEERGLRYVHPTLVEQVDHEKGTAKYKGEAAAGELLRRQLADAGSGEEYAAVAVRAFVLAHFADAAAAGQRMYVRPMPEELVDLIEAVANQVDALSPELKDLAAGWARAREQAKQAAVDRAEAERAAIERLTLEATVARSAESRTLQEIHSTAAELAQNEDSRTALLYHVQKGQVDEALTRLLEQEFLTLGEDGQYDVTPAGHQALDDAVKWWREEGREQALRASLADEYGDLDTIEREDGPEERKLTEEEINQTLERYRKEWAEQDAADEKAAA